MLRLSSSSELSSPDHLGHEDNLIPQVSQETGQPSPAAEPQPFEYELLTGHKRTDGKWKTSDQLRMQYIQLTDNLIYDMTHGVEVVDPLSNERRLEKPDVVVWLDKSARPLSWLVSELWPTMAPDSPGGEVPKKPLFKFVNIDKKQWVNAVGPEGGRVDISKVDDSIIRSLRSIFMDDKYRKEGLTEAIDSAPAQLDDKTILIVDEVYSSGKTLSIATKFFEKAFPTARITGRYWMSSIAFRGDATGNSDLPVWYKENEIGGRGVGNRNPELSVKLENSTMRNGAWFLGTRIRDKDPKVEQRRREIGKELLISPHDPELLRELKELPHPDPASQQLRKELGQLAHDPNVLKIPSLSRPDKMERMAWLNMMPTEAVIAKMNEIKAQRDVR